MRTSKGVLAGLVLLVAVLQIREVRTAREEAAPPRKLAVGALAPSLDLLDVHGNRLRLEDPRGRVVLVTFWAGWCAPCRAELPELAHHQDAWNSTFSSKLALIAVNPSEQPDEVLDVLHDPRYKQVVFAFDQSGVVARDWLVRGLPMTFAIDRESRIEHVFTGYDSLMRNVLTRRFRDNHRSESFAIRAAKRAGQ